MEAPDPFTGPFSFDVGIEGNPRLARAARRRLRQLGQWVRLQRWYVDDLLRPNVGEPGTHVSLIYGSRKTGLRLFAYLNRPLGEIVMNGAQDFDAVMQRIDAAVECFLELQLDVDEGGLVICRQATVRPRDETKRLEAIPRTSIDELLRRLCGFVEEQPRRRTRPTEALAEEAVSVYLNAAHQPARAVAEHFGWRMPGRWSDDYAARAKVNRVMEAAERKGLVTAASPRCRRSATRPLASMNPVRVHPAMPDRTVIADGSKPEGWAEMQAWKAATQAFHER